MQTVFYEWDLELWEPFGSDEPECLDHQHADKLCDLPTPSTDCERLVLVRDAPGSRLWAYVENGMLPKFFSRPEADGKYYETNVKVPQRFHREIAKEMSR